MWIFKEAGHGTGLRVGVKDLIDVAGLPTTAGSRAVADRAEPAATDAACLAGLRAAAARGGACLAGKTNLHELAYGISGINGAFGTPVNPLDPARVPGGSSSGSAAAVASGEADVAYGSDTGGSIRIPAACCGVAGLKTTWGRIPLAGVWPLAPSLDTVGPMARGVAGLMAGMTLLEPGFTVTAGPPQVVGRVDVGADPVIDAAVDAALAATGWAVVPVVLDGLDAATAAAMTVLDTEAWASDGALARSAPDQIGRDVLARLQQAGTTTQEALRAAWTQAAVWRAAVAALWDRVDLLALPTLLGFPPTLDHSRDMAQIRGVTSAVNLAGVPALALPVPSGGPLPASIQLIGPPRGEDKLLAAGAVLEQAVRSLRRVPGRGGRRMRRPGQHDGHGHARRAGPTSIRVGRPPAAWRPATASRRPAPAGGASGTADWLPRARASRLGRAGRRPSAAGSPDGGGSWLPVTGSQPWLAVTGTGPGAAYRRTVSATGAGSQSPARPGRATAPSSASRPATLGRAAGSLARQRSTSARSGGGRCSVLGWPYTTR